MFRNQIDERKVIDAVKRAIGISSGIADPIILPEDPNYPSQLWIELPKYTGLTSEDIDRLQKALHRGDFYSISIHAFSEDDTGPVIRVCAYVPNIHPNLIASEHENL